MNDLQRILAEQAKLAEQMTRLDEKMDLVLTRLAGLPED